MTPAPPSSARTPEATTPSIVATTQRMIAAGMEASAHLIMKTTMLPKGMEMSVITARVGGGALAGLAGALPTDRGACT